MSRYLQPRLSDMDAYVPGEQPKDRVFLKLNTNESPFPPAPQVLDAVTREDIEELRLYSDPTCLELRQRLAGLYGLKPENIFLANGSDDILNFAFWAFSDTSGAAFADITYGFYSVFAKLHGVTATVIPLEADFSLDYRKYCGLNRLIVIANPNAPTGLQIPVWQVEEILKTNPDSVVVIDEAYVDFGGDSCYRLLDRYDNLLVVRTFSKSRNLAGGRLGYALGSPALIGDLEKLKYCTNPYNVNRLTQKLGVATVDAEAYYREKCEAIIRVREWTGKQLEALGFTVLPSHTNFLFAAADRLDGAQLYEKLKERGILVRHFSTPRISRFNRITIGTQSQMETLIRHVTEILQEVDHAHQ